MWGGRGRCVNTGCWGDYAFKAFVVASLAWLIRGLHLHALNKSEIRHLIPKTVVQSVTLLRAERQFVQATSILGRIETGRPNDEEAIFRTRRGRIVRRHPGIYGQ